MTFDRKILDNLYRYCLSLTANREDAEDLLHSALEKFLQKNSDEIDYPIAYIRRTARNCFYDRLRRQKVIQFETLDNAEIPPNLEKNLEKIVADKMTIERIWESLNVPEREVVFLWAVEKMSASEISRELNQPRSTILSRLYRMRKRVSAQFLNKANGDQYD